MEQVSAVTVFLEQEEVFTCYACVVDVICQPFCWCESSKNYCCFLDLYHVL